MKHKGKNSLSLDLDMLKYYLILQRTSCYILSDDRYTAEDVVQETFLAFLEHNISDDFYAWPDKDQVAYLKKIVKNKAIDLRRRQRETPVDPMNPAGVLAHSVDQHEKEIFGEYMTHEGNQGLCCVLEQALQDLPVKYRRPLLLKHVYDYSGKEIAAILRIYENTVYKRIERAKRMLRESIHLTRKS